jgi:hypothetical protein
LSSILTSRQDRTKKTPKDGQITDLYWPKWERLNFYLLLNKKSSTDTHFLGMGDLTAKVGNYFRIGHHSACVLTSLCGFAGLQTNVGRILKQGTTRLILLCIKNYTNLGNAPRTRFIFYVF